MSMRFVLAPGALACSLPAPEGSNPPPAPSSAAPATAPFTKPGRASSHAHAMDSRLFQDVLEMAESEYGAAARKTCLGCHAPVAVQTGDLALRRK